MTTPDDGWNATLAEGAECFHRLTNPIKPSASIEFNVDYPVDSLVGVPSKRYMLNGRDVSEDAAGLREMLDIFGDYLAKIQKAVRGE